MQIDRNIINSHQQIYEKSCVPSAVEMMLKLACILDPSSNCLQEIFGDNNPRSGADFDNKTFTKGNLKIIFHQVLFNSLEKTFNCIDSELNNNRCVLIPLKTSPDGATYWTCHVHIICDFSEDGEYKTITKLHGNVKIIDVTDTKTRFTNNYKEMVTRLPEHRFGIDIITYERL